MKYLFVIVLLVSATACYKYEKEDFRLSLPAKTQSGAHTLGYLLNNEVWQNYGQTCNIGGCPENLSGSYFSSDRSLSVSSYKVVRMKNKPVTYENFGFSIIPRLVAAGTYKAGTGDSVGVSYVYRKEQEEKTYYPSQSQPDFTIVITRLNTSAKILSGEFSGKLFLRYTRTGTVSGNLDSVEIKDGRFDIRLK